MAITIHPDVVSKTADGGVNLHTFLVIGVIFGFTVLAFIIELTVVRRRKATNIPKSKYKYTQRDMDVLKSDYKYKVQHFESLIAMSLNILEKYKPFTVNSDQLQNILDCLHEKRVLNSEYETFNPLVTETENHKP